MSASPEAKDDLLLALVTATSLPVGVVDLSTRLLMALSETAEDELGASTVPKVGADISTLTNEPESTRDALDLLGRGAVERYEARGRIPHPDGSANDVQLTVEGLAPLGLPDRALVLFTAPRSAVADPDGHLDRLATGVAGLMRSLAAEHERPSEDDRVANLEAGLLRISEEIDGLGLVPSKAVEAEPSTTVSLDRLTERERDVVERLVSGQRVPAIAQAVYLSQSTVRNHLWSVYRKLGVHSQVELLDRLAE